MKFIKATQGGDIDHGKNNISSVYQSLEWF